MDGKALLAAAVFASTCNGTSEPGDYSSPSIPPLEYCSQAPDPGSAFVMEASRIGDEIELLVDYVGCDDAEISLCTDDQLEDDGFGPTLTAHIGMYDPDGDSEDCWGNRVTRTYRYNVLDQRIDAAYAYPEANELTIVVDGFHVDFPVY